MRPHVNGKTHRRKAYWNEPKMGWWERAYLLEILRGLASPAASSCATCGDG